MPASNSDWSSDRRLDIMVLGPMGESGKEPSTVSLQKALYHLLDEPALKSLLDHHHVHTVKVHVPEGQAEQEIVGNILRLLDSADLVVLDLSQKNSKSDRANVFYELALVHALGIPALLVVKEGDQVPFYARTSTQYRVANFNLSTLADALRAPLREFLDLENRTTSFSNDRVSQYYGLPIVDISAAVGLATGYYYNFISRLLTEGGYIAQFPDKIRQVVYVRPTSVHSTYEADHDELKVKLAGAGLEITTEKYPAISADPKGPLWFEHVNGVVVDVPRTIYPLQRAPRLLSLEERNSHFPSPAAERNFIQRMHQLEESMLSRVEAAIRFQLRHDGPRVRSRILHFTDMSNVLPLVNSLV